MTKTLINILIAILTTTTTITESATTTIKLEKNNQTEEYSETVKGGSLEIKWGANSRTFPAALGRTGETYRALIKFNKWPAIFYENSASSTSFRVYYTIKIKNDTPIIDCMYSNIRNAQNGTSIRKAICNLEKPLARDYQELIYKYSDKWIDEYNSINLEQLTANKPKPLNILVGNLDGAQIILRYDSLDDLISETPRTLVIQGNKSRDLGTGNIYFVYDADGRKPLGLDVETNQETHIMERLRGTKLLETK